MIGLHLARAGALAIGLAVTGLAVALAAAGMVRGRRHLARALGPRASPPAGPRAAGLALAALGLVALSAALAGPSLASRPSAPAPRTAPALDVALVVDASRSMRARDVAPDRLGRAKLELGALLRRLPPGRTAVIAFAGSAFVQAPLSTDREAATLLLDAVAPEAMPVPGTAIAPALDLARRALGSGPARAVVLVTDGEDHAGGAEDAAARLARDGASVWVLGTGTVAGATLPPTFAHGGAPVQSRLDEDALARIARAGGGASLPLARAGELRARLAALARDAPLPAAAPAGRDLAPALTVVALLLLALGAVAPALRSGRAPRPRRARRARAHRHPPRTAVAASVALALLGVAPFRAEHEGMREANRRLAGGDAAAALAGYDAVERELGPRPEIDLARGDALVALGRRDDAARAFSFAARAPGPAGSRGAQNLAHVRLLAGDEPAALRLLREALVKDPANLAARHDLEVLLRRRAEAERDPGSGPGATARPERGRPEGGGAGAREEPRPSAPTGGERQRNPQPASAGELGAMAREEAERLLDAVAASERPLPAAPAPRAREVERDW